MDNCKKLYYNDNVTIKEKSYFVYPIDLYNIENLLHRSDGPALLTFYPNGNKKSEYYYINGELHRENLPALVTYYEDSIIKSESYFEYNMIVIKPNFSEHKEYYNDAGKIKFEKFGYNNYFSPNFFDKSFESKPTKIEYYNNKFNTFSKVTYLCKDKFHNNFGPSIIEYELLDDSNELKILSSKYYIHDHKVSEYEYYKIMYILQRSIRRYKRKKRSELINNIKQFEIKTHINLINKDELYLVSLFLY